YTQQQLEEWIKQIKVLPSWLDACIENLDADQLHTPYRPEGWTVAQVIHHISDSHINAFVRLKLALTEESPNVKPYQEDLWAKLPDTHVVPVNVSITLLHALHQKMVAILNNIQPHDWERTFYHPQHGRYIQVWQLAALYAWHGRHHVAHITGLRDRMGW
ncbi:MAG: putative metal-dependent hydrolase, partial [Chitinophagia bacterium]|nr:putative metal-dependent hydrolase [Chitinophagia bacterium]